MAETAPQAPLTDGILKLAGGPGFSAPASSVEALPGPRGLPLIGNLHQLDRLAMHATLEAFARQYGPLFRMRFGATQAICISDPTLIGAILRHRPKQITRSPKLSGLINETGFRGLFTAEGDAWRRQRRLVMRALTPEAVRHFFPVILEVTRRLRKRWSEATAAGQAIDVPRDLKRYSIDVTTWLAMGIDVDTLNHQDNPLQGDVELWFATIGRRLPRLLPYWRYVRLPADRRSDAVIARLQALVSQLIADARARLAADPALRAKPRNILEALVAARDEPGSEFTDDDVNGNVATMLFAGEDTTANAMAWLVYHLAGDARVAAKVRAEAAACAGETGLVDAFGHLGKLEYLEAAAVESMRVKPIAPMQGARASVPMDLAGLLVPKGQVMFLLTRVAATSAANFAEPLAYRPERWTGENAGGADETTRKIFPFGGGPRYCPGRYLAMVEIKMVAAMALAHFDLALEAPAETVSERFTFTMGPDRLPIRFAARETSGRAS